MNSLIFGYTWEEIQRAQQGGRLVRHIEPANNEATEEDKRALKIHGVDGLKACGFDGTLDRLRRAGLI